MKLNLKKISVSILLIILVLIQVQPIFALSAFKKPILEVGKNSEEYLEWLELSEDERKEVMAPNVVDVAPVYVNSFNPLNQLGEPVSSSSGRFSLKDIIPNNVVIRSQGKNKLCWAYAALGSLESAFGLRNYYNGNNGTQYDFSEIHAAYASSNYFENNVVNRYGLNQVPDSESSLLTAHVYLTNGMGVANESDMPTYNEFPRINYNDFCNINKHVQVNDIEFYGGTDNRAALIAKTKENIVRFGGVSIAIHGAQPYTDAFNSETGAIYCDDVNKYPLNHAVVIVGWDDNYSRDNFVEGKKPSSNGAFIIKNSWGEKYYIDFTSKEYADLKELFYNTNKDFCNQNGINNAASVPNAMINEALKNMGFEVNENNVSLKMGDNGFMFISYEDVNVLNQLFTIESISDEKNYTNIYQYDYVEYNGYMKTNADSYFLAVQNQRQSNSNQRESIEQVSMWLISPVKAKVYVNTNGNDIKNAREVPLAAGEYETLTPGYHTLEFASPVEIEGDTFTVYVKCEPTEKENGVSYFPVVTKAENVEKYNNVSPQANQTFFYDGEGNNFVDLGIASTISNNFDNYIATLKVFTDVSNNSQPDNPQPDNPPGPNPNPEQPTTDFSPTDFSSATSKCENLYDYTFSDSSKQEYVLMDVSINNISVDLNRDYSYEYYLSNSQLDSNISDWHSMEGFKKNSNSIQFTIDTRDHNNFADLKNGQRLYVYIKETEKISGKTNTYVSKAIMISDYGKLIVYKDGSKVSEVSGNNTQVEKGSTSNYNSSGSTTGSSQQGTADNTVAKSALPNAGFREIVYILVCVVTATGLVLYVLYRRIDY